MPAAAPPNPALPLLLTNRQLRTETAELLTRPSFRRHAYFSLDVVYLTDATLWPTWTGVPFLSDRIDTLYVHFRIFKASANMAMEVPIRRGMFQAHEGAPEAVVWVFYHLLVAGLKFGPRGDGRAGRVGGGITVRRLVM